MGNEAVKQATRYRTKTLQPRKNFSIDVSAKRQFDRSSILIDNKPPSSQHERKKSLNVTPYDDQIMRYLDMQKQSKQIKAKNKLPPDRDYMTLDSSPNKDQSLVSKKPPVQKDRILANLSRKNQELRKELKEINEKLTEKLKKKKLVPKKKKQEEEEQNMQQKKEQEAKAAALRRQLQNGHRQIDMYKRTLQQLNAREEVKVTHTKVKQTQNQVAQLDRIINETMKKIEGMRNIKKHQEKNLENDINQDLIDNLELLKRQEEEVKAKIKELNKRDQQREQNYKRQQAYLFEVQKKYREVSGQYFPELKKKGVSSNGNNGQNSNVGQGGSNKKPSTFDKYQSPGKKKPIPEQVPSVYQVSTTTKELNELRAKHDEYHRKIDSQIQTKNKTADQISKLDQEISAKQRIIESLKLKLVEIRKIIRPNKKALFGYDSYEGSQLQSEYGGASEAEKEIQQQHQQDQFDIKHLIANIPKPIRLKPVEMEVNNSIRSGASNKISDSGKGMVVTGEKSQPKVWGTSQTRKQEKGKFFKNQLSFDDSVQFQNTELQPLIIGINGWVNKNGDVLALQAIYLNGGEIRYGVKSSVAADGFIVRYDLQAPDYLKNITGGFNQQGTLEYIAFFSKKGKSGTFGNKRENQQSFTFGLASTERPFRLSGATIMVDSEPRICRVGIQICNQ